MSRLIDADALELYLNDKIFGAAGKIKAWLDAQPTVDAVPVVRCKDCKKRPMAGQSGDVPTSDCPLWCGYCFGVEDGFGDNFYCAVGERRESE